MRVAVVSDAQDVVGAERLQFRDLGKEHVARVERGELGADLKFAIDAHFRIQAHTNVTPYTLFTPGNFRHTLHPGIPRNNPLRSVTLVAAPVNNQRTVEKYVAEFVRVGECVQTRPDVTIERVPAWIWRNVLKLTIVSE